MLPSTFCSPFRLGRCWLPGARRLAPPERTSTGVPDWAMKIPATCQPPRIAPAAPLASFRKGSSYTNPDTNECVRSKSERP